MIFSTSPKLLAPFHDLAQTKDVIRHTTIEPQIGLGHADPREYIDLADIRLLQTKKSRVTIRMQGRLIAPFVTLNDSGKLRQPNPLSDDPRPFYVVAGLQAMTIPEHPMAENKFALSKLRQLHILTEHQAMEEGVFDKTGRLKAVITGTNRAKGVLNEPFIWGQTRHLEATTRIVENSTEPDPRIDVALEGLHAALNWLHERSS